MPPRVLPILVLTASTLFATSTVRATSSVSRLSTSPPIVCTGGDDVELRGRSIDTPGTAVAVRGNCDVHIVDSHLVSDGTAIEIEGNGTVFVVDSYVQGADAAVQVDGNGDFHFRGSTLRGGLTVLGHADTHDRGGNVIEIARPVSDTLTTALRCHEPDRRLIIDGQSLAVDGVAIDVDGGCEVHLSNGTITATTALQVGTAGVVRLRNVRLAGAVSVADGGRVLAAGVSLGHRPELATGARWRDGGGNDIDGRVQRITSPDQATVDEPARDDASRPSAAGDRRDAAARGLAIADTARDALRERAAAADGADRATPARPGESLVGTWRVDEARIGDRMAVAGGTILLLDDGTGVQEAWLETSVGRLTLDGAFTWRAEGALVHVDTPRERQRWRRIEVNHDRQQVARMLDNGIELELVLVRRP